jgi:hypothetical protein
MEQQNELVFTNQNKNKRKQSWEEIQSKTSLSSH